MNVLVVDDDRDVCDSLALLLGAEGHTVWTAASGNQAAKLLEAVPAPMDLVISDYYMDDGDGAFLLEFVKARPEPRPAFFLITGKSNISADEARRRGASEFFVKPFDVEHLLGSIAAVRS